MAPRIVAAEVIPIDRTTTMNAQQRQRQHKNPTAAQIEELSENSKISESFLDPTSDNNWSSLTERSPKFSYIEFSDFAEYW
jgi:hypothetical protein